MRYSYLEREVPTGVEEDHDDDMNELDIVVFTDDDIKFQVHNIEEMVRNIDTYFWPLFEDMKDLWYNDGVQV
jgi:hypothetical protein